MLPKFQPNHVDWTYKLNDEVTLDVYLAKAREIVQKANIEYNFCMELMLADVKGKIVLKDVAAKVNLKGVVQPSFKTLEANITIDGSKYSNFITVGFDTNAIKAATPLPNDFEVFWETQIKNWMAEPLFAKMKNRAEKSTDKVDVYNISYNCNGKPGSYGAARFFGVFAIPKSPGKYTAIYYLQEACVCSYNPVIDMAEKDLLLYRLIFMVFPLI